MTTNQAKDGMSRYGRWIAVLMIAGTLGSSRYAAAQMRASIQIGLNGSSLRGSSSTDFSPIARLSGGVGVSFELRNGFSLQPEVLYIVKGAKADGVIRTENVPVEATFDLTYLEIPVLLVYRFPSRGIRPMVFAGPSLAVKLDAQVRFRAAAGGPTFTENDESVENRDLGLALGAGIEFDVGGETLAFGARTSLGFSNARKDNPDLSDNPALYNTSIGVFAAIVF